MPEWVQELITESGKLLPVLFFAILGGIVNQINRPREQFSWWWLLVGIVTAAFVGIVVHLLLEPTSFPSGLKSATIGISGYASREVLSLLKKRVLRRLKKGLH